MDTEQLRDLQLAIADRLYIQIENWNLYLGDAGLSEALAIECKVHMNNGAKIAARRAIDSVQVKLGGGSTELPLSKLISSAQVFALEDILETYC
ncbi:MULTISPECIES: DUF3181 family protein [unclassified Prochlorococcus]|uniref:DUF3181 family protein n=1 Tax=unclassified Prochlorococcus TaxID=2627481 RepID=UPI00053386DD|nr:MULTISPECIES: DUF3181 family protein [unclassified Prochlorococcus]KGG16669.1 hypothetical protein EV06_0511 [Prochlorococcus sp. MIT 0602]KGG18359.1 hypothetical protein EV07_0275 [Prochlorococcus sp. MIT 0603]